MGELLPFASRPLLPALLHSNQIPPMPGVVTTYLNPSMCIVSRAMLIDPEGLKGAEGIVVHATGFMQQYD
jgi:hypothetical protein